MTHRRKAPNPSALQEHSRLPVSVSNVLTSGTVQNHPLASETGLRTAPLNHAKLQEGSPSYNDGTVPLRRSPSEDVWHFTHSERNCQCRDPKTRSTRRGTEDTLRRPTYKTPVGTMKPGEKVQFSAVVTARLNRWQPWFLCSSQTLTWWQQSRTKFQNLSTVYTSDYGQCPTRLRRYGLKKKRFKMAVLLATRLPNLTLHNKSTKTNGILESETTQKMFY
jgi:hypothetical protein